GKGLTFVEGCFETGDGVSRRGGEKGKHDPAEQPPSVRLRQHVREHARDLEGSRPARQGETRSVRRWRAPALCRPLRGSEMRRIVLPMLVVACLAALVLACFGTVLVGGQQFAYRDAAQYYYPLYQRVQQEWRAGRVPLWEAEENAGMPLLGNPAAAVL